MKQCPNCKHEVREDTGICPYCGYHFEQRRIIRISIPIIPILLTLMFLLPVIVMLFAGNSLTSYSGYLSSLEKGTALKEVDTKALESEWMTFNSYATFSNYFSNGSDAMNDVLSFEKGLEDFMIGQGYSYKKEENAVLYANYLVKTSTIYTITNQSQQVILEYQEDNLQNEALKITLVQEAIDFEGLKVTDESSQLFDSLYTYLTNKPFTKQNDFLKLVQGLEDDFNKYYGRISHYGLNASQDDIEVKITSNRNQETYLCEYTYQVK